MNSSTFVSDTYLIIVKDTVKKQGLNRKTDSRMWDEVADSQRVCSGAGEAAVCVLGMCLGDGTMPGQCRVQKRCSWSPRLFSTCCDCVLQSLLPVFAFLLSCLCPSSSWFVKTGAWWDWNNEDLSGGGGLLCVAQIARFWGEILTFLPLFLKQTSWFPRDSWGRQIFAQRLNERSEVVMCNRHETDTSCRKSSLIRQHPQCSR